MSRRGTPTFSAAVTPTGVYVVGYRRKARGLDVGEYAYRRMDGPTAASAGASLGELIEAQGGRGGTVSLALSGFGSCHQILTLPPAPREVLLPVIGREMRRVFPDLSGSGEPIIDYVEIGAPADGREEGQQRDVLAAAVPRTVVQAVHDELSDRGIQLGHWTVLPRTMQRLHDAFAVEEFPTAALLVAENLSLLGFFHAGELRLFSETHGGVEDAGAAKALAERVDRGGIYLRQQFQGAELERVLLSAEDGAVARELSSAINDRVGVAPERFGPYSGSPGAMLAFGPALDAMADDAFDLLPLELRPPTAQERWSRILAYASVFLLLASAAWWAGSAVLAEHRSETRLNETRAALDSRWGEFTAARAVVDARRAHAQRVELVRLLLSSRERLPEILWPLESAPPALKVRLLEIIPTDGGWTAVVEGSAEASSTSQATAAIDALFRSFQRELPGAVPRMEEMSPPQPLSTDLSAASEFVVPIAITFRMSFIVPAVEEAVR